MGFKESVEETPNLQGKWMPGLGALRPQDKARIDPENTSTVHLRGSVDVDTAWAALDPGGNRWDFAIGYKHQNRSDEFIYWVETHTGADDQIAVMSRKLTWLKTWLTGAGRKQSLTGYSSGCQAEQHHFIKVPLKSENWRTKEYYTQAPGFEFR